MVEKFRRHLWDAVSSFRLAIKLLYVMSIVFMLLLVFSLAYFSGSQATFVILVVDFLIVGAIFLSTRAVLARC